ncbi:DUF4192 domain-containing protein [Paeniglutamicibacter sp. NPDC012692]|uniref:DUF4192 domain-containing protein n=1 Tax=Paeniglutamicibacter sp. NPDC012692 TaxID=3364388 RepID=UPI0036BF086A
MTTSPSASNFSLASPDEVLAYIPHALGFYPRNSVVLLIMQKAGLAATLRVDLPVGHHEPADERIWVRQLVNLVHKVPRADAVFVAFYTDQSPDSSMDWPPRHKLLQALVTALMRAGIQVRDGWHVGSERWHSYFCSSAECCPAEGFALPDLALTETHLRMVVAGSAPEEQLWDGGGVADWPNKEAVRAQVLEMLEGFSGSTSREQFIDGWARLLDADPAVAEQRMRGTDSLCGELLASLHDKTLRDLLPYLAGRGAGRAMQAFHEVAGAVDFGEASQDFSDFLLGTGGAQPDWERMDRLWFICRDLLGVAAGQDHAALLCLLGWLEWAKGRGSSALNLLKAALRTDPGYRLAQLLLRLLEAGEMPSWVADPDRAWHRKLDGRLSA